MSDVNINLNIITNEAERALARFKRAIEGVNKPITNAKKKNKSFFADFRKELLNTNNIARGVFVGGFGANLAARAVGEAVRFIKDQLDGLVQEYRNYELALVGVQKTTGLSRIQAEDFGAEIQKLSQTIPVATNELLRLAQVAAQLGVRDDKNLAKFAETAARLSDTVEGISGEQAAIQLARITKLTGESNENVDRLAASLTELGNNFAVIEGEVVNSANEIARAGAAFGITANESLAFATAFKEAGVQSELTGSTVSRVLNEIASAASKGGKGFDLFADTVGSSVDQLKQDIQVDGGQVLADFFKGLDKLANQPGGLLTVKQRLDELGLSSIRNDKTLLPLIKNYDNLNKILGTADNAYENNTALIEESSRKYDTLDGSIKLLGNSITTFKTTLGAFVSGPLRDFIDGVTVGIEVVNELLSTFRDTELETLEKKLADANTEVRRSEAALDTAKNKWLAFGDTTEKATIRLTAAEGAVIGITKQIEALKLAQAGLDPDLVQGSVAEGPQLPDENEEVSKVRSKNQKLLELEEELQNQRLTLKFAADGVLTEHEQLTLQVIADARATARENERLREQEAAIRSQEDRDKFAKLETKTLTDQAKRQISIKKRTTKINEDEDKKREQNTASTLSTLASLQSSSNKEFATIAKAAALAQIAIKTPEAVGNAIASDLPYPLNLAAAVAVAAAMAAQAAQVAGVKFQDGGIVGGNSFSGDKVPARVNSGEMILNREQQGNLFNLANGQGGSGGGQPIEVTSIVELDGEIVGKTVSRQVANGLVLGENL